LTHAPAQERSFGHRNAVNGRLNASVTNMNDKKRSSDMHVMDNSSLVDTITLVKDKLC